MLKWINFATLSLFLTACGNNPQSYITGKSSPIVNIDSAIHSQIDVNAKSDSLTVTNLSNASLQLAYKLFWYDKLGITQPFDPNHDAADWQAFWLESREKKAISLIKPTAESENYRIYVK